MFDEEAELYYLRSRYYRPGWGRFVSTDPLVTGGSIYRYTDNSPTNHVDDDGLSSRSYNGRKPMNYMTLEYFYNNGE